MLETLFLHRRQERQRGDYALQLLWLTGLELFHLGGGKDYPVPSPAEAFAPVQEDSASAEDIRLRILRRLREERSEP